MKKHLYNIRLVILVFSVWLTTLSTAQAQKIKGITLVAPPSAFQNDPLSPLQEISADYIKLVPYGFTRQGQTSLHFNMPRQWWGEREEGVVETIKLAKEKGIGVMLKPQVYIPGGWIGDLNFDSEEEWSAWEANYKEYIFFFLDIAIREEVEIFCIGTELKQSIEERPAFWKRLISEIREDYCGLLTYSANWDNYKNVNFWNDLDFIGVSSYFPLCEDKTPEVNKLVRAWKPIVSEMRKFSKMYRKPMLFTEYGYLSVDGCAGRTWELEKKVRSLKINEEAQANALEAMYQVFWKEDFWAGGFMWKWFPEGKGGEGYNERDYTPQDKLSIEVLKNWFENDKQ